MSKAIGGITKQAIVCGSLLTSGFVHAGCSYTGLCGTITFLGQTADRTQAIFLVQTTKPGTYSVQATEGGASGPVDTWRADAPGSHVVVSPFPASYGGTHILNSQVIGPGEFVDSAYQNPGGRVFPVGYVSPDSRPVSTVVHVTANTGIQAQTVNQAQPPVVAQAQEQTVAVQQAVPTLVIPPPKPVQVPPIMVETSHAPVATPSGQPGPTGVTRPQGPVVAPTAQQTLVQTPVVVSAQPGAVLVDRQINAGAVIAPPAQQPVITAFAQPGPTSVTRPQGPVVAPTAQQPTVQTPEVVSAQPGAVLVDLQNNAGAVIAPLALQPVITATAQPGPTSVTRPQGPVVAPIAQHTTVHTPVVIGVQPGAVLVDRQNNAGAVIAPPAQRPVITAVLQPGPTSVTRPQGPVIGPPARQPPQVVAQPPQPPRPHTPLSGTGNQPPQQVPHTTPTTHLPLTQPPVVVATLPSAVLSDKQNNPGVVVRPPQQQVLVQTVAQSGPTSLTGPQGQVNAPQPTTVSGTVMTGSSTDLPPALSDRCMLPSGLPVSETATGLDCQRTAPARLVVWADTRNQKNRDMREGVQRKGLRQLRTVGAEWSGDRGFSYGVAIGDERESGTVLGELTRYETYKLSISPYVRYAVNDRWSVTGGLSYTRESTYVAHAPLDGAHKADHWGLSAGMSGYFPFGDHWGMPSFQISRNFIRTHAGHIQGAWAGQPISVVVPASREKTGAITASYDHGRTVSRREGVAYVMYGQVAVHYDYTRGVSDHWSGDLRAGLRAHSASNLTFDLSVSKLGIRKDVSNTELRLTLLQAF